MALEVRSLYIINPTDLVTHPENLTHIAITHDGVSVSYMRDSAGWYTFGEYTATMDSSPATCVDVTPETVIFEVIRALALSVEEPVDMWLA